ncbi:probable splicing factor YJU2B, partial [Sphaerodactylus townsendi]|uniref:probable splicing factor YJU2B n=1 Tax=Sphaerodactylus townsendi TaxID=933632 RepID=UPI002025BC30
LSLEANVRTGVSPHPPTNFGSPFHLPAYEDKQKQKRSAIADRPWFSSPPASGTKSNDTLRKLGLSGKSPAGKSPIDMTSLGVLRRKSRDGPGASTEEVAAEDRQGRDSAPLDAPAVADGGSQTAEGNASCSSAASLVADYSDSSSDADAEL